MHKSATKCNETIGKWCKNKHGASKIIDTFETYHSAGAGRLEAQPGRRSRPSWHEAAEAHPGTWLGGPSGEGITRSSRGRSLPRRPRPGVLRPRKRIPAQLPYSGLNSFNPAQGDYNPAGIAVCRPRLLFISFLIFLQHTTWYTIYILVRNKGSLVYPGLYPRHLPTCEARIELLYRAGLRGLFRPSWAVPEWESRATKQLKLWNSLLGWEILDWPELPNTPIVVCLWLLYFHRICLAMIPWSLLADFRGDHAYERSGGLYDDL
jgi:hypothetical protein